MVNAGASTTVTRKRKSTGTLDETKGKAAKQPRKTLDAFFSPQVLATTIQHDEKATREHVALNVEQVKVLKMAVEEEKNVFFTGSAGKQAFRLSLEMPMSTRRR